MYFSNPSHAATIKIVKSLNVSGLELYERLKPYLLTEEQLDANNFPRPDPASGGKAVFLGEDIHAQKVRTKGTLFARTIMAIV